MSVADAKARGVKDGDLVRVYNEWGEIVMPAYVSPRITPGTTNVGYGGWYEPSSAKTDLMPDGIDRRGAHNFLMPNNRYPWIEGCASTIGNCEVQKFDVPS